MIFVIVASDGWALYRCQKQFVWASVRQLVKIEKGQSGLVFRDH
jgi:hypothetical protein